MSKYQLNLKQGVVIDIPTEDDLLNILTQELNCSQDLAKSHLVNFECNASFFEEIPEQGSDVGYVELNNIEESVAQKIIQNLIQKFNVAPKYSHTESCPYCGSKEFTKLNGVTLNAIQFASNRKNNLRYDVIPAVCHHCGLNFNYQDRSLDVYQALDRTYDVSFSSSISNCQDNKEKSNQIDERASIFKGIEKAVTEHCPNKDALIIEYGSFDGYFIKLLQNLGYKNIYGYEPNPNFDRSLPIYTEFFNKQNVLKHFGQENVDCVCSRTVFEVIPDVHEVLLATNLALKIGGYTVIEVPSPIVVNSLQLYRMTVGFIDWCCREYGMQIVKVLPETKPYICNQHTLIVAKKVKSFSQVQLEQGLKDKPNEREQIRNEVASWFASEQERKQNVNEMFTYANRRTYSREHIDTLEAKIKQCEQKNLEVIIYGAGVTTGKILNGLQKAGYKHNYDNWIVVKSGQIPKNMFYTTIDGLKLPLKSANDFLANRHVGLVIYAVQSLAYFDEITANLKTINCKYEDYYFQDYLQQ